MSSIEKSFIDGDIIIKEGDTGNTFFQLLEGKVTVYKNYEQEDQVEVAVLSEGQYFGEMAVIETYPRSTSVVAKGDVKVLEIAAEELNEYLTQNPDKILTIMKLLGSRIESMTQDCEKAKKLLDEVRSAHSSNKYDGFFKSMIKQSIYLSSKNIRLERPSAEALREAAEAVSQQDNDNAESYAYGTIIYKQDEVGKCMYILHEGSVGIYKNYGGVNELKTSDVTPVACFGEMGLLSEKARDTTAVAETDNTSVEIIHPEDLEGLFKTAPAKIELILKNLSFRLRNLNYDYFKACKEIYEASKEEDRRY